MSNTMRWQTTGQLLRDRPQCSIVSPTTKQQAASRRATAPTPPPIAAAPLALDDLFRAIQILATRHGWTNQYTYNADGPDAGLQVILIREGVLFAEVALTPEALSTGQQDRLAALRGTGQVEAYVWTPADLPQIQERLRRTREAV
jgi:hypothetical protein